MEWFKKKKVEAVKKKKGYNCVQYICKKCGKMVGMMGIIRYEQESFCCCEEPEWEEKLKKIGYESI